MKKLDFLPYLKMKKSLKNNKRGAFTKMARTTFASKMKRRDEKQQAQ